MSVVRLKTLFWEIERRKLASGHLTQPETGATLISPPQLNSTELLTGLSPFCAPKGRAVFECPTHIPPRPNPFSGA
ncbi:hypothetical protein TNIN_249331, partial [Trichonephila inaurata madagascariensis]